MNLKSCDECGVILDMDRLPFAKEIHNEHGDVNHALAEWHSPSDDFRAFVPCPVCTSTIVDTRAAK